MKNKIYRILYLAFTILFYYVFLGSYLTMDFSKHVKAGSHMAFLVPSIMLLIAMFFTPFIIGAGLFLFLKYPKQKRYDFWHYCLIYPGFAIFAVCFLLFFGWWFL